MERTSTQRGAERVGGGAVFGAALAAATGSTPIGIAIVAGLGAALAWKSGARRARERH